MYRGWIVVLLLVVTVGVVGLGYGIKVLVLPAQAGQLETVAEIKQKVKEVQGNTRDLLSDQKSLDALKSTSTKEQILKDMVVLEQLCSNLKNVPANKIDFLVQKHKGSVKLKLFEDFQAEVVGLVGLLNRTLQIYDSKGKAEAVSFFEGRVEPVLAQVRQLTEQLDEIAKLRAIAELRNLHRAIENVVLVDAALVVIAVVSLIIIQSRTRKRLLEPIRRLTEAAEQIQKGNLDVVMDIHSDGQIGLVARTLAEITWRLKRLEQSNKPQGLKAKPTHHKKQSSSPGNAGEQRQAQEILQRRIKQLNCFYGLSKLAERPDVSIDQIFEGSAELIRLAYQHPERTSVRITFDGIQYKTKDFQKSELSQCAQIKIRGEKSGSIEVYYHGKDSFDAGSSPFLKEEREMLDAVAEHLGRVAASKQSADKLHLFRSLINRSNDCIFVIDSKWGRLLDVNDRACERLGYSREELLDMTIKEIDEAVMDNSCWRRYVDQLEQEDDVIVEGTHRRKDGSKFPVETSLKLVSYRKEQYIIAITRDITERKRAEENRARLIRELKVTNEKVKTINQELRDFAYVVSHDLKAPLRGIRTLADWLFADYADKIDEKGREQINLLRARVERMHNLIDGVLQYSRVGRVREKKVRVDLNELIPEVIDMVSPPDNIEIKVVDRLPVLECERTCIMRVFENLLSNAVKYMDKPRGRIRIGCKEEGNFWRFSVSDNGPGIEEKYFDKIFRIFQTLSSRDEFESTGIGLTVVKKIVELNGGKVWLESQVGRGSTFYFTIPKTIKEVENAELEANIAC